MVGAVSENLSVAAISRTVCRHVTTSKLSLRGREPLVGGAQLRQLHLTQQCGKSRITPKAPESRLRLYQHDI
jgi:hypothetical protein